MQRDRDTHQLADADERATLVTALWSRIKALGVAGVACFLALAFIAASLLRLGFYHINSDFMRYDDEGYLLIVIRQFLDKGGLYDQIFTNYGPFFYLYNWIAFRGAGDNVSHDAVRLLTLLLWVTSGLIMALAFRRLSKGSNVVTLAAFLLSFLFQESITQDPGHPIGFHIFLLSLVCLAASYAQADDSRALRVSLALGFLTAALALTKVNLGAFATMAFVLALTQASRLTRASRWAAILWTGGCIAMPLVLVRSHWSEPWALNFGIIGTVSIATAAGVSSQYARSRYRLWPHLGAFLAGGLVATFIALAFALATGSSLGAWLSTTVWRTFIYPSFYSFPAPTSTYAWLPWAIASALLAGALSALRSSRKNPLAFDLSIVGLKLLFVALIVRSFLTEDTRAELFGILLTFAWLGPIRTSMTEAEGGSVFARTFISLFAAIHIMVAYPVCGGQMDAAFVLYAPIAALCLSDAVNYLKGARLLRGQRAKRATVLISVLLIAVIALLTENEVAKYRHNYEARAPLNLPGANDVRLTLADAGIYQWIANNLRARGCGFFTNPGLNSFYLWTGIAPPTGYNVSAWMLVLDEEEERAIIDAIEREECFTLLDSPRANIWLERGIEPVATLLQGYLHANFEQKLALPQVPLSLQAKRGSAPLAWANYLLPGERRFSKGESDLIALPPALLGSAFPFAVELWFETSADGVLLSLQQQNILSPAGASLPLLYVDTYGHLRGGYWSGSRQTLASAGIVNDGHRHHAALVVEAEQQRLFLDGVPVDSRPLRPVPILWNLPYGLIGSGFTMHWPAAQQGWFSFEGKVEDVIYHGRALSDDDISTAFARKQR